MYNIIYTTINITNALLHKKYFFNLIVGVRIPKSDVVQFCRYNIGGAEIATGSAADSEGMVFKDHQKLERSDPTKSWSPTVLYRIYISI